MHSWLRRVRGYRGARRIGTSAFFGARKPAQWVLALVGAGGCVGLAVSLTLHTGPDFADASAREQSRHYGSFLRPVHCLDTEMAELALNGRPGHLTDEQTEALKDMWARLLQIFGRPDLAEARRAAEAPTPSEPEGNGFLAPPEEKPRRGIGRMLRRNTGSTATSAGSAHSNPDGIVQQEEKYESRREYLEALEHNTPEELRETFWRLVKCDDPDSLLLRFLRARKWHVGDAIVMLVATIHWRTREFDVESILQRGEEWAAEHDVPLLQQLRVGKSFFHGTDKYGRPLCYVRVRLHKPKEQDDATIERFTVYVMEMGRLMLHAPVDTACVIFDMTDFSLANMDYNPVKFIIKCFEAHYPESLGVLLIHKAPWVFQGIWNIIKGWLDPVVASKIQFTRSLSDLGRFIEPHEIIQELGGPNEWSYTYPEPKAGENAAQQDTKRREEIMKERAAIYRQYEDLTVKWAWPGDQAASKQWEARRSNVARVLVMQYWILDKYTRARSIYDRTGVIGPAGQYSPHSKSIQEK